MLVALGLGGSEGLLSGWRRLAEKATPQQAESLITFFTGALRFPSVDASTLKRDAGAIAVLHAPPSSFARVGAIFLSRMQAERDPGSLADLGSAVAVLRAKLPQSDVEQAAAILVRRMVTEHRADEIGPMASALDDLDEGISKAKAREFAGELAVRMGSEQNPRALMSLAIGFIAVAQQMEPTGEGAIAPPLLARMQNENVAAALRTLAFSLGTIEDEVDPSVIRNAGSKLVQAMAVETEADNLRTLAAGLCALKSAAGRENFEKAASILIARIGLETDPSPIQNLAASLHALADNIAESDFDAPSALLVNRMIEARDPAVIRGLANGFRKLAPDVSPSESAQLASKLAMRTEAEQAPDLLRAYGEVLGLLREGSLTREQLSKLPRLFSIADAPCQVVSRVKAGNDAGHLVPAILNPLCSEDSWNGVVTAFDNVTHQGIVQGEGPKNGDEADADFKTLTVPDDDDGPAAADAGTEIDFNRLSRGLEKYRSEERLGLNQLAAEGGSAVLVIAGLILLLLAWERRTQAESPKLSTSGLT
jgi:hypothetical protein